MPQRTDGAVTRDVASGNHAAWTPPPQMSRLHGRTPRCRPPPSSRHRDEGVRTAAGRRRDGRLGRQRLGPAPARRRGADPGRDQVGTVPGPPARRARPRRLLRCADAHVVRGALAGRHRRHRRPSSATRRWIVGRSTGWSTTSPVVPGHDHGGRPGAARPGRRGVPAESAGDGPGVSRAGLLVASLRRSRADRRPPVSPALAGGAGRAGPYGVRPLASVWSA